MLADRAGVNLPEIEYSEEARKAESKRSKLLEINREAAKYFYFQLRAKPVSYTHLDVYKRQA